MMKVKKMGRDQRDKILYLPVVIFISSSYRTL